MATIIKREGTTGVSYRLQFTIKHKGSGKRETKTMTWRPPEGLTEREVERLLKQVEIDFENQCKNEERLDSPSNREITVAEYSKVYLEYAERECSKAYYASAMQHTKLINEQLGNYKLKDLNPLVIQKFVDKVKQMTYTRTYATAKPTLAEVMKEQNLKAYRMQKLGRINDHTVTNAVKGINISVESADKIAEILKTKTSKLFTITSTEVPYAAESIAKTHRVLKAMLSQAKRQLLVNDNFATSDYITGVEMDKKRIKCFNKSQVTTLMEYLKNLDDIRAKTSLMLIVVTGLRRSEVVGLEWHDINFEENEISIKRAVTSVAGFGVVEGDTKSRASNRTFTLSPGTMQLLRDYKKWWDEFVESLGDCYTGTQKLFLRKDSSKIINPSTILYWLHKAEDECGLPRATVHSLRHSNISMQLISGLSDKLVSKRAGHANTKVTKDIYWEIFKEDDIDTASAIDSIFGL